MPKLEGAIFYRWEQESCHLSGASCKFFWDENFQADWKSREGAKMKFEFPAKNDDSLHKSNQTSLKQNELSSKKSLQLNYFKNHLQPWFFYSDISNNVA